METRETLTRAVDILRRRGRTQTVMLDKEGRCCALLDEAIAVAT